MITNYQFTLTTIVAGAGFLLSLVLAIKDFIIQRPKIWVKISEFDTNENKALIRFSIANKSVLPITITDISIEFGQSTPPKKVIVHCAPNPVSAFQITRTRRGKTTMTEEYSTEIPMSIMGYCGRSMLCYFESLPDEIEKGTTYLPFLIQTNRGHAIRKRLLLPPDWIQKA